VLSELPAKGAFAIRPRGENRRDTSRQFIFKKKKISTTSVELFILLPRAVCRCSTASIQPDRRQTVILFVT